MNSSPDNQHFTGEQKEKSVWNFRTFTVYSLKQSAPWCSLDYKLTCICIPIDLAEGSCLVGRVSVWGAKGR